MAAVGKTSNKPCHEPEDYDRVIALFHFATDMKRSLLEDHLQKNGLNVIDLFNAKREEILMYEDIRQALRKTSIVLPSDLSLNTLNYILKSHCYKLYWNSCLDEAKLTLEEFLNTHRSKIYKLTQCTMQDNSSFYLPENSILLSKEDFKLLFVTELDPSHLEIKQSNDHEDTFFAKRGIQLFSLSYELQNILLNALCPLREAVNHVTALQRNICKSVVLKEEIHHEIWSTMEKYTTIIAKEYNKISEVKKIQSIRNSYQGKKQCLENHRRILDDALNDFFFLDDLCFCQRVRSQLNDLSLQDVMNLCGREIPVVLQHGQYRNGLYPEAIFKHADNDLQCFVAAYGSQVDESGIGKPSQKDCESLESKMNTHNYLKLIVLLKDMGQKVFIDVLKDRLPGANFGNAFQGMRDRLHPYLNNNDFKKLCPDGSVYSGDLHDLELSLLYVILRCLNTIPPHGQGWGSVPAETDRSISANIDRIRIAKNNYVSHFPNCYLPHDVFKKAWEVNRKCIIELGGETYEETIDKLLTTAISPIMERELIDAVKRLQETDRLTLINIKTLTDMIAETLQALRYFNSQINGARIVQDDPVGMGQSPAAAITLHIAGSSLPSERQLENRLEELDSEHTSVTSIKNGSIIFGLAISAMVYKSPGFLIWVIDNFLQKVFLHSSARIKNDMIIVSMVKTDRDIRNMVPLAFRKKCEALDVKKVLQYLEFDRKEVATGNVLKMLVEYLVITADDYTFITHTFSGKKQAHQLLTYLLCTKKVWLPGFLFIIQQVHGTTTIENLILKAADLGGFSVKSDADEEDDIYRCGRCNYKCSSLTTFLRHKADKCQTHQGNSNPDKDVVPVSDILAEDESFLCKKLSSMITQEQENFCRHSTVIVDETRDSFLHLLDFHLTNQGITLQKFIEINGHTIYHLCFNSYPCCQCPPDTRAETKGSTVLHPLQMKILFEKSDNKLPVHNSESRSAPNCCCPVNPNLQLQDLDFTLARILLVNFTKLVPQGSLERNALDFLDNSRNHLFDHAKEGKMSNSEYQKSIEEIEKSLLVLAKVCGKETEIKQRLYVIAKQPFNSTICIQLLSTLLQQCQIDENEDYVPEQQKLKGQEGIEDTRFKQKCHVCDKEPSVYWCHGCQRSMCQQDCNNQHRKSTATKYHIVQHVQDMYSLDYNFKVNVEEISDIKVLHDVLVIADLYGKQLVTCDITGQQQHTIPLSGVPYRIAVVDNNTVAVTLLFTTTVVIVDVRQRQVIQRIDVKVVCHGIMYRDNQLFVGCDDRTIKVMNMSRKVTRTIPVGVRPLYICGGEVGRIYYTDHDKLYCIDTVGNTLFTFTDPNMSGPRGITTDDEGHVLVICHRSNNVLRISPDGKQSQVIITQIPSSGWSPYICYNSLSKSVVIGRHDNVYVYKKV